MRIEWYLSENRLSSWIAYGVVASNRHTNMMNNWMNSWIPKCHCELQTKVRLRKIIEIWFIRDLGHRVVNIDWYWITDRRIVGRSALIDHLLSAISHTLDWQHPTTRKQMYCYLQNSQGFFTEIPIWCISVKVSGSIASTYRSCINTIRQSLGIIESHLLFLGSTDGIVMLSNSHGFAYGQDYSKLHHLFIYLTFLLRGNRLSRRVVLARAFNCRATCKMLFEWRS